MSTYRADGRSSVSSNTSLLPDETTASPSRRKGHKPRPTAQEVFENQPPPPPPMPLPPSTHSALARPPASSQSFQSQLAQRTEEFQNKTIQHVRDFQCDAASNKASLTFKGRDGTDYNATVDLSAYKRLKPGATPADLQAEATKQINSAMSAAAKLQSGLGGADTATCIGSKPGDAFDFSKGFSYGGGPPPTLSGQITNATHGPGSIAATFDAKANGDPNKVTGFTITRPPAGASTHTPTVTIAPVASADTRRLAENQTYDTRTGVLGSGPHDVDDHGLAAFHHDLDRLQGQLHPLNSQIAQVESQLTALEAKLVGRGSEADGLRAELATAKDKLRDLKASVQTLNEQIRPMLLDHDGLPDQPDNVMEALQLQHAGLVLHINAAVSNATALGERVNHLLSPLQDPSSQRPPHPTATALSRHSDGTDHVLQRAPASELGLEFARREALRRASEGQPPAGLQQRLQADDAARAQASPLPRPTAGAMHNFGPRKTDFDTTAFNQMFHDPVYAQTDAIGPQKALALANAAAFIDRHSGHISKQPATERSWTRIPTDRNGNPINIDLRKDPSGTKYALFQHEGKYYAAQFKTPSKEIIYGYVPPAKWEVRSISPEQYVQFLSGKPAQ